LILAAALSSTSNVFIALPMATNRILLLDPDPKFPKLEFSAEPAGTNAQTSGDRGNRWNPVLNNAAVRVSRYQA
jgi:hypothetical protein